MLPELSVVLYDMIIRKEFDRIAERIADGAADQASTNFICSYITLL